MRVAYFGTASFAVPALRAIADQVVAVVTQAEKPSGRGLSIRPSPVKVAAEDLGIPVYAPLRSRAPEAIELFRSFDADIFIVAAYGQILSPEVLEIPRLGCFNLHGSILPRWRGAAPIQRAVEAGDTTSGVTLMVMDAGMDTGDIIAIAQTAIDGDETAGGLYNRLADLSGTLAAQWMPRLATGDFPRQIQNSSESTHAKKVTSEQGHLSVDLDVKTAYNRYRAFTPSPGAILKTAQGQIKILEAKCILGPDLIPGQVIEIRPDLILGFNGGGLRLIRVQPEGRKAMNGADFANGARLRPGMRWQEEVTSTGE